MVAFFVGQGAAQSVGFDVIAQAGFPRASRRGAIIIRFPSTAAA